MIRLTAAAILLALPALAFAQSTATVDTLGEAQSVLVDQTSAGTDSRVTIDQIGTGGAIMVVQASGEGTVDIFADGDDQSHQVIQTGGGANVARITSNGANNTTDIAQNAELFSLNELDIVQSGTGNAAVITQEGIAVGTNRLDLIQSGNGNTARLTQNGRDNNLTLTQNNDANMATITQNGDNLGFSLTQNGGETITVTQTNPSGG